MDDLREKVINELVEFIESALSLDSDYVGCVRTDLLQTVVGLLKANEPRVLQLNEIHREMTVWLEDVDKSELLLAIGGASCHYAKTFITENDRSIAAKDSEYNIRWRAWTSRPTEEQREVMPWVEQKRLDG